MKHFKVLIKNYKLGLNIFELNKAFKIICFTSA